MIYHVFPWLDLYDTAPAYYLIRADPDTADVDVLSTSSSVRGVNFSQMLGALLLLRADPSEPKLNHDS